MIAVGKRSVHVAAAMLVILACLAGAPARGESLELEFETQCLDLDAGDVAPCPEVWQDDDAWDVLVAYHAERETHSVLTQQVADDLEVAFLEDRTFEDVTAADAETATFSNEFVDRAFDVTVVILVRTPEGNLFKLGDAHETDHTITFAHEQL